jgi:hypothetical protein
MGWQWHIFLYWMSQKGRDYDILKVFACTNLTNESYSDLFPHVLLSFICHAFLFTLLLVQGNTRIIRVLLFELTSIYLPTFHQVFHLQIQHQSIFFQHIQTCIDNDSTTTYGTNTNRVESFCSRAPLLPPI